jgi:hypothetical protein
MSQVISQVPHLPHSVMFSLPVRRKRTVRILQPQMHIHHEACPPWRVHPPLAAPEATRVYPDFEVGEHEVWDDTWQCQVSAWAGRLKHNMCH